ncbi:MAG: 50S ribosomal protein L13 [Thermaerobacterales bacterium]
MRTTTMTRSEDVQQKWHIIDAAGVPLGRLATRVAHILRGKHRPSFTPYIDNGDHVIVINAERVALTGNKLDQKMYYRHSGFPGGLKEMPYRRFLARSPERVVRKAVWGMIPKTRLGRRLIKKLRVYAGSDHPHEAQQPQPLALRPARD